MHPLPTICGRILLTVFASAFAVPNAYSQVFKCTDTSGRITFSDQPCHSSEKSSIAHRALTPRQQYSREAEHQRAMAHKSARQYQEPAYSTQSVQTPRQIQATQSAAHPPTTGPGDRPTISRLLPHGAGIAQREAAQKKEQEERRARALQAPPSAITHCTDAFCYDNQGGTYSKIGGGMMSGPNGKMCHTVGDMVYCN